jgi:hypothetical protein
MNRLLTIIFCLVATLHLPAQTNPAPVRLTINARLTPAKGGAPVLIEVHGTRANPAEVINALAAKVNEALKISSNIKEWNVGDEAAQYFDEAKWAMKWGVYPEAQMAADSAWALGKRDMDCAMVRIKACSSAATEMTIESGVISPLTVDSIKESDRDWVIRHIKRISDTHLGAVFNLGIDGIDSVVIDNSPDQQSLDCAIRALDLYYQFSQTIPPDELKTDSSWYGLGVESLTVASRVLQHFYLVPKSQGPVLDKLAKLRALARSVAARIKQSSPVRDTYFSVDSNPDKERRILIYNPNIYHCEMNWGCFWQEQPDDCITLYRELLGSSAFAYFNEEFGSSHAISYSRGLERPRMIAWNEEDRKRIPVVWENFVRGLSGSTNQFLESEAKLFINLDASGLSDADVITNYDKYWQELKSGKRDISPVEAQKKYLEQNQPYDYGAFDVTFAFQDYSKSQALKIYPLLTTYRSNVVTQIDELDVSLKKGMSDSYMADTNKKNNLMLGLDVVDKLLKKLVAVLDLPEPAVGVVANPEPDRPIQTPTSPKVQTTQADTNSLLVTNFFSMPQEQFWTDVFVWPDRPLEHGIENEEIWEHSWQNRELVLGVKYNCNYVGTGDEGYNVGAIAILNPATTLWEIILYPKHPAGSRHKVDSMTMFQGNVYLVDDELTIEEGNRAGHKLSILKYDRRQAQWQALKIQVPDTGGSLRLFVVSGRLFAASVASIFEITDDGRGTHVLASTRRRPPATTLDLLDSLGSPLLYSGPGNALCAIIANGVYAWDGIDWKKTFESDFKGQREMFDEAILFRTVDDTSSGRLQMLQMLPKTRSSLTLGLYQKSTAPWVSPIPSYDRTQKTPEPPKQPLWPLPEKDFLSGTPMSYFKSDAYFFINHAQGSAADGQHAELVCLSRDCTKPIIVPLKFDLQAGPFPVEVLHPENGSTSDPEQPSTWLLFTDDYLFIGEKHTRGAWMIPTSEIKSTVAAQKQIQLAKMAAEKAPPDQRATTGDAINHQPSTNTPP